ncbi:hypothetical protein [Undibacterium sp. TJN19]|uniref:hypothetical protein n=1 Tax=Undibacterium sp. TJN19 TaxID=3413055 RepID=UPI003BF40620
MSSELFWQALEQTQTELATLSQRDAMEKINELLQPHFPDLSAELQKKNNDGEELRYELIFTAHGASENFQDVMALTASAPRMPLFEKVIPFRMRTDTAGFTMSMNDFSLSPTDILVNHFADAGKVGLQLWFNKVIPQDFIDHAKHMSFILLDHVLGEYDFAIKIGPVEFMTDAPEQTTITLDQFPPVMDAFWRDDLLHTAIYPDGEHNWTGFTLVSNTDPEDEMVVQRNESAQSLVGRADMVWYLQVQTEVNNSTELEQAREFEDQLSTLIERMQEGICTQISLQGNVRTMEWQVSDIEKALGQAQKLASSFAPAEFDISSEFDAQWHHYLRWAS